MIPTRQMDSLSSRFLSSLLVACITMTVVSISAVATLAQTDQRPTSLDIVPQSAAFYYASMNHEAQIDALLESNAWDRMMDSPVGKAMRSAYRKGKRRGFEQFGYGNPFAQYLQGYHNTVGSDVGKLTMSFLKQVFGQELFIYADQDWLDMGNAITEFYMQAGETMQAVEDIENMSEEDIKAMLALAKEHLGGVNTPTMVIGTVLKEPEGVKSLLQLAEGFVDTAISQMPEEMNGLVDGFDVINEKELYLITLQLDAESLPWDELEGDSDLGPYLDDIRAIAKGKSFNLSLGIKDSFLVMAVGPDNQHIKSLGSGKLLIDHPKLAKLKAAAAKHRMTTVGYYSEAAVANSHQQMEGLVDTLLQAAQLGIEMSGEQDGQLRGLMDDLMKDGDELKADIIPMMGKPGAYLGFSYMFDGGCEGYTYNWSENKFFDASKPLTILDQLGEAPVIVSASRDVGSAAQFKLMRKWTGKIYNYVTKYVPRAMDNKDDVLMFIDFTNGLRPILAKVADSTEENLLPATAGQEAAFVMDWSNAKKSWHAAMPRSAKPLPGPAMSLVIQHKDRGKILQAGGDYFEAAEDVLDLIRDIPDADVPDEVQIYDPEHKTAMGGDLYFYKLPPEAGLDDDVAFHALVTDDRLVLGHSMEQTGRLMGSTKTKYRGLLADHSQPAMTAFYFDNRRMVEVLEAWIDYGIDMAKDNGAEIELDFDADSDLLEFDEQELMESLDTVMDLLKCFDNFSSYSFQEDGATVTRYQMRFQDIEDK